MHKTEQENTHGFKYWIKIFFIALPLVAFASYLSGEWSGNVLIFLRDVLIFNLTITILLVISDKLWKKWGDKILFRKVF